MDSCGTKFQAAAFRARKESAPQAVPH
ncbi:hypothetical protein [Streptomyces sp. NPDC005046]